MTDLTRRLVTIACCLGLVAGPTAAQPPEDLMLEHVAGGFTFPIAVRNAGDGSDRLFVVEQDGLIKIIDQGSVLPTPFLDLTAVVLTGPEQGLLGLAFHPDYAGNGYFYVNYTRTASPLDQTVIARYSVSANPDIADPASATTILEIDQPSVAHNAGDLHFSPVDGYLYIGMGDGGGPPEVAQDLTSLLGKMLRIDVDGGTPYAVPADNPYVGNASARDEIWASGLRNPWRWSFDRVTGDLLIGDVGEGEWEEMDFAAAGVGGLNFGWPCKEGNADFMPGFCSGGEILEPPFFELSHDSGACSMIGGYFYRGAAIPSLFGHAMFNDWCSGESFFARQSSPGVFDVTPWDDLPTFAVVSYGESESGELHLVLGSSVVRLVSPSGSQPIFSDGFESGNTSSWSSSTP